MVVHQEEVPSASVCADQRQAHAVCDVPFFSADDGEQLGGGGDIAVAVFRLVAEADVGTKTID